MEDLGTTFVDLSSSVGDPGTGTRIPRLAFVDSVPSGGVSGTSTKARALPRWTQEGRQGSRHGNGVAGLTSMEPSLDPGTSVEVPIPNPKVFGSSANF